MERANYKNQRSSSLTVAFGNFLVLKKFEPNLILLSSSFYFFDFLYDKDLTLYGVSSIKFSSLFFFC